MRDMRVTLQPVNVPYVCSRCSAHPGVRSYFIDTGIDSDFEGTVYICDKCAEDFVNASPDASTSKDITELDLALVKVKMEFDSYKDKMLTLLQSLESIGISPDKLIEAYCERYPERPERTEMAVHQFDPGNTKPAPVDPTDGNMAAGQLDKTITTSFRLSTSTSK